MSDIARKTNQLLQASGTECRNRDEQEWQDIAEEEFEVSSTYSPMSNYASVFLRQADVQ